MASRLVATVDGLLAELSRAAVPVPPMIVSLLQKMMTATPPTDADIVSTLDSLESHIRFVRTGSRDSKSFDVCEDGCTFEARTVHGASCTFCGLFRPNDEYSS